MTTPLALGMFEFLGKLMGMSIRNRMNLPFRFPSIVRTGMCFFAFVLSLARTIDVC
jgi:hypothetical protein